METEKALNEKTNDFKINCIICMESFDKAFRKPMVLPCGHTFCLYCMSEMKAFGKQQCPSDRETFIFSDLKLNFILFDIIEQGYTSESKQKIKINESDIEDSNPNQTEKNIFDSLKKKTIEKEGQLLLEELTQLYEILDENINSLTTFLNATKNCESYEYYQKSDLKEILSTSLNLLTGPFSKRSFLSSLQINCLIKQKFAKAKRDSALMTHEELSWLKSAFLTNIGKSPYLKLLYRASRDGFSAYDFHLRSDDNGPNLVICQSEHFLKFGGYNDFHYSSDVNGNNYKSNYNQAFLFSLSKRTIHRINKGREQYAIHQKHDVGPHFGVDLHIASYCNANIDSYSNLGCNYAPPKNHEYDSEEAKCWLAGEYQFRILDYEVFQVLFS